jgi:hypothetical protein
VSEGRAIFENIQRFLRFQLTTSLAVPPAASSPFERLVSAANSCGRSLRVSQRAAV